jgi:hypothetical protein
VEMISSPASHLNGPMTKVSRSYCAPLNLGKLTNPVVGLEFFGRLEALIPLAANATLWSDRDSKPLLSFTIAWLGDQLRSLGNASVASESTGAIWSYNMANFADRSSLPTLPDGTDDGITSGRIDFEPSRSVALATRFLDRYFGESISISAPSVQVATVDGQWVQKGGCR